jgi:broad specificity polyphosphatase/5'/3'-nucleotidase SurE
MEGIIWGVSGVAVSLDAAGRHRSELRYGVASWVAENVISNGMPANAFLNVNVPDVGRGALNGILLNQYHRYSSPVDRGNASASQSIIR